VEKTECTTLRTDDKHKDEGGHEAQTEHVEAEQVLVHGREELIEEIEDPPGDVHGHDHGEEDGAERGEKGEKEKEKGIFIRVKGREKRGRVSEWC
jgi:hypothetical protein